MGCTGLFFSAQIMPAADCTVKIYQLQCVTVATNINDTVHNMILSFFSDVNS